MIYIVELPHQGKSKCWAARDESDAIGAINETYLRSGEWFEDFATAIEYNGAGLSSQLVYMSDDDALAALDSGDFGRHNGASAEDALRAKLILCGALEDVDGGQP